MAGSSPAKAKNRLEERTMPRIPLPEGASVHCFDDDYLWPWDAPIPVVMMHGFARNALFWNRWVPAIAETRRVYRPELLGCGLSDPPPAGYRYTPDTIGGQIIAVLDALSLRRVHWVGESSGGIIGLLLAAGHPERIASLVLCNTPTRIPDQIKRTYALDKATASDAMRAYGVGEWCRRTLGYRLDTGQASRELCDWVVNEMGRTAPAVAAAIHDCFEDVDTVPLLPRIAAPVLLLSGDKSPIASAQQQTFAEKLANGRVELVPGVGHGVNLLQPERCARVAADFWRSLD
jgi:pimeloyl-ACP methyl ester carboxylesterase